MRTLTILMVATLTLVAATPAVDAVGFGACAVADDDLVVRSDACAPAAEGLACAEVYNEWDAGLASVVSPDACTVHVQSDKGGPSITTNQCVRLYTAFENVGAAAAPLCALGYDVQCSQVVWGYDFYVAYVGGNNGCSAGAGARLLA